MPLDREEYVEQAYFFRTVRERIEQGGSVQELLGSIREELLSTTKLPIALDYLGSELRLTGRLNSAMARLSHYFTPFQSFVMQEAERDEGKFDMRIALEVLEREADYRSKGGSREGFFLYQFETLCRNRLGYDRGLDAVAADPVYDDAWREWIITVRRQVGIIDIADLIFVRSEHYQAVKGDSDKPVLFGEKEGKIALANRHKDPLFLFSALARHLNYPMVPRPKHQDSEGQKMLLLARRLERLEQRIKLLEEELRGGINLTRFYADAKSKSPSNNVADAS